MRTLFYFLIVVISTGKLLAQEPDALSSDSNRAYRLPPPVFIPIVIDPGLSMRSGAENVISMHQAMARFEDGKLGTHWFSERTVPGKTGGVVCRFAKFALLDLPVDYFSVVFAHEYFGHGARYRELNLHNIDYGYDVPPPYGKGGGQASANITSLMSDHEMLAIWSGGLEVQPAISRRLSLRWLAKKEIYYREALLYFWSWQIGFNYIQSAGEDLAALAHDDDPQAYVRILNRHAGYVDLNHLLMSVGDLKARNRINLANPFLLYSIITAVKSYLWGGVSTAKVPMLSLGAIAYLPCLRMGLTPFGPEYHFENYLRTPNRVALVDLRIGDQKFHGNWGGLGILVQNLYTMKRLALDMSLQAWKQPEIEVADNAIVSRGGGIGGLLSLRGYYEFTDSQHALAAVVELGYKSSGFLESYELDSSPIVMLGLALREK